MQYYKIPSVVGNGKIIFSGHYDSRKACVEDAIRRGLSLYFADLDWANLKGADLRGARLSGASFKNANLNGAQMNNACIDGANFEGALLNGVKGLVYKIAPPSGSFIAWKKGRYGEIIKLKIPWFARRCSVIGSRKCRAELAIVLEITWNGKPDEECLNWHDDYHMEYRVGHFVGANKDYNPDPRVECTGGIHFFMTREEAENWG